VASGPAHVARLSWGGAVIQELYRRQPELVASLILADTYAGWRGSLPPEEVRARVSGAYRALAVPAEELDVAGALPGWFAGDPPASVARQFEHAIRDAALVVIPGAGHVSNLELPAAFNDAVREVCLAHPPA
jgi:pimeloyl-ACP methyl ester carboxylesterase